VKFAEGVRALLIDKDASNQNGVTNWRTIDNENRINDVFCLSLLEPPMKQGQLNMYIYNKKKPQLKQRGKYDGNLFTFIGL